MEKRIIILDVDGVPFNVGSNPWGICGDVGWFQNILHPAKLTWNPKREVGKMIFWTNRWLLGSMGFFFRVYWIFVVGPTFWDHLTCFPDFLVICKMCWRDLFWMRPSHCWDLFWIVWRGTDDEKITAPILRFCFKIQTIFISPLFGGMSKPWPRIVNCYPSKSIYIDMYSSIDLDTSKDRYISPTLCQDTILKHIPAQAFTSYWHPGWGDLFLMDPFICRLDRLNMKFPSVIHGGPAGKPY